MHETILCAAVLFKNHTMQNDQIVQAWKNKFDPVDLNILYASFVDLTRGQKSTQPHWLIMEK
jgi:hypothetical protein